MLNKMKAKLDSIGYIYYDYSSKCYLVIEFPKCVVEIHETLEDKLFVRVKDYEDNIIAKNSYKTVGGAYNFFRKNIID